MRALGRVFVWCMRCVANVVCHCCHCRRSRGRRGSTVQKISRYRNLRIEAKNCQKIPVVGTTLGVTHKFLYIPFWDFFLILLSCRLFIIHTFFSTSFLLQRKKRKKLPEQRKQRPQNNKFLKHLYIDLLLLVVVLILRIF